MVVVTAVVVVDAAGLVVEVVVGGAEVVVVLTFIVVVVTSEDVVVSALIVVVVTCEVVTGEPPGELGGTCVDGVPDDTEVEPDETVEVDPVVPRDAGTVVVVSRETGAPPLIVDGGGDPSADAGVVRPTAFDLRGRVLDWSWPTGTAAADDSLDAV